MNIKKHIPNAITCGNLFCGCLAIVSTLNGNLIWGAYLVGIATVLDFFDGFIARLLKVSGEIGKQLDSLADMVSFGVVPGVMMYQMIKHSYQLHAYFNDENEVFPFQYIGFIITIFSCIRLAKFNIDTRQNNSFIGVPTPANTILICSLPLINEYQPTFLGFYTSPLILNFYFLIALTLIMSSLLIAEIPLFALKFKNFGWKENKIKYIFLIISIFMLVFFRFLSIPFLILFYVGLSFINNRRTGREK